MASNMLVPSIQFDELNHTYTVNGEDMPSVTTVLADAGIIKKDNYPSGAAIKGKDIHKLIQLFDENDLDMGGLDDEQWLHLNNWNAARLTLKLESPKHELIVFHQPYKYAGTIDVFDLPTMTLVEIKSGRKERWHKLQLAAYKMAYECYFGEKIKVTALVYTHPNVDKIMLNPITEYEEDIFTSLLNVAEWKNHGKSKRKSRDTEYYGE